MTDDKKTTFLRITTRTWWSLRNRFKQAIPPVVTSSYLSAFLNMTPQSAADNVIRPLRMVGLVDRESKPTDRARRWRDDEQYPGVCEEVRREVYPEELLAAFPEASPDGDGVRRWFANHTGHGANAAGQMAAFYLLLLEADPTAPERATVPSGRRRAVPKTPGAAQAKAKLAARPAPDSANGQHAPRHSDAEVSTEQGSRLTPPPAPSLHIDIQIHISPEASTDQIDQIFRSMGNHLYRTQGVDGR